MQTDLEKAVDDVLIQNLPQGLKDIIDRLLARGASKAGLMSIIRVNIAKASRYPGEGQLTEAAVEAYLEAKS